MRGFITIIALIFSINLLTSGPTLAGDDQCIAILDANCVACHYKSRICQQLGKKNEKKWQRTIKNMIRHGVKISKEDRSTLVECLVKAQPGTEYICNE
ncbi:MAG: hypothetical protein OEY01_08110 [Desulfobulbaceae bacterium]|nr:hypothetical protein [Desulfobulbaceae bacterium]